MKYLISAILAAGAAFSIRPCAAESLPAALKPINQTSLQSVVTTTAKELSVPGALVFLRTPQGDFTVSYGTTQLGTTSPPLADTHFRIASNTKTMTAAIIIQLAQEAKLKLSDPVSKYVDGVPNGDKITIANLLQIISRSHSRCTSACSSRWA